MSIIKDNLYRKGTPAHIPNCSRNELPKFLKEQGYKVGAEIGVYKAEYTKHFCEAGLKMYAVDPYMAFTGQGRTQNKQDRQDFLFGHAQRYLKGYDVTFIRKTSMEALEDIKDNSLDFVFIDGDHNFKHVAEDIFEWSKKVRDGGVVAGHDYCSTWPKAKNVIMQVQYVVDAYVKTFDIPNFYTFGGTDTVRKVGGGDNTRSWMWIK